MARIVQMKNGLEDKKNGLKKELDRQKAWIRLVDVVSIILLVLMFLNKSVFATTSTSQSFDQIKQQNQQQFEAESKKMQEEYQQKSSQMQQQYKDNAESMDKQYNENVQKMQQEYNDSVKKMQEQHDANVKQQQQSQQDNGKKIEAEMKKFNDEQTKQLEDAKKSVEAKKQAQSPTNTAKTQSQTSKSSSPKPLPFALIAIIVMVNMGNRIYRWTKMNQIANQMNIYSAGIKGEANALESLEKLSNDYIIITNPMVYANGRSNELDNLIIGSNGVFIVETKNYVGTVYGDVNDQKWVQERSGRKTKEFYNPIMQVNQHGKRAEEFLRRLGYSTKPTTMVYFVNPNVDIKITGVSSTEVFKHQELDTMINRIEYFKGNVILSESDKEAIIKAVANQNR